MKRWVWQPRDKPSSGCVAQLQVSPPQELLHLMWLHAGGCCPLKPDTHGLSSHTTHSTTIKLNQNPKNPYEYSYMQSLKPSQAHTTPSPRLSLASLIFRMLHYMKMQAGNRFRRLVLYEGGNICCIKLYADRLWWVKLPYMCVGTPLQCDCMTAWCLKPVQIYKLRNGTSTMINLVHCSSKRKQNKKSHP